MLAITDAGSGMPPKKSLPGSASNGLSQNPSRVPSTPGWESSIRATQDRVILSKRLRRQHAGLLLSLAHHARRGQTLRRHRPPIINRLLVYDLRRVASGLAIGFAVGTLGAVEVPGIADAAVGLTKTTLRKRGPRFSSWALSMASGALGSPRR